MKLLFSEADPDYSRYLYPYVVWAFLEDGETPADAFESGFLPGGPRMDRFYLTRQIRVPLEGWKPTSENRRVLRHGARYSLSVLPRSEFHDTPERRTRWLDYAGKRFAPGAMPPERLERLMTERLINHLMTLTDSESGAEVGSALLHVQSPRVVFYHFAFYEFTPGTRGLGMILMTRAVEWAARAGFSHFYLGTCYSESALYKAQFDPTEFFNGFRWSRNLDELKHLVRRVPGGKHQLECPEFLAFQPAAPAELAASGNARIG
jgi:arginyl-tRNA--protein-N-Asp/Glu arginylyltransferase